MIANKKPVAEEDVILTVVGWIDIIASGLSPDAGRATMKDEVKRFIASGTIPTMQAIASARDGNVEVDAVLRELAVEMLDRGEMPGAALRAYAQEALLRAPVTAGPGRRVVDTWLRDLGIQALVDLATATWSPELPKTRNRASRTPSICSLVSAALNRRGVPITERQVERIAVADIRPKVSALIPPV